MSNSFIQVPVDAGGKRVDAEDLLVSGTTVQRQRVQIAGLGADDILPISATDGLPVSQSITTASRTHATTASVAAGGSTDLDCTQISSGLTGKLMQLLISSTVPFKAQLHTVLDGVPSAALATFVGRYVDLTLVSKKFITVAQSAGAGVDTFRVTIVNLDTSEAADVYATFFYDEE